MKFFTLALTSLIAVGSVLGAPVADASKLEIRTGPSKLPATITIFASQGSTQVGCIAQSGNFTRNLQWCFPFRVFYTTGVDGNIRNGGTGTGCTVDSGILDCRNTATNYGQFYQNNGNVLTLDGPTLANYSINSFPTASDTVGVPLVIGSGGTYSALTLKVTSTSG